jgi:hypothetical protein
VQVEVEANARAEYPDNPKLPTAIIRGPLTRNSASFPRSVSGRALADKMIGAMKALAKYENAAYKTMRAKSSVSQSNLLIFLG